MEVKEEAADRKKLEGAVYQMGVRKKVIFHKSIDLLTNRTLNNDNTTYRGD